MSRVSIGILGGAVLTAGLVMYGSWNWSLRSESELRLRRAMILEVHDQALETARKTNDELRVQSDGQQNQITKLEAELKGANEREASLRTQLGEAQNSMTSLKAKMDETQRRLVESERLVGEYQKPKQALDTVAATNIAPTVSSP